MLEGDGFAGDEVTTLRPLVAAALVLPAASVSRYLPRVGTEGVARALRLPFAAVCLREAELLRVPTALVVPGATPACAGMTRDVYRPTLRRWNCSPAGGDWRAQDRRPDEGRRDRQGGVRARRKLAALPETAVLPLVEVGISLF